MKTAITLLIYALLSPVQAKTITVGIDLSGSNPLLRHKNFAATAGRYVARHIAQLKDGDIVNIQTFGARNSVENILKQSITVSRRNRAKKLAIQVSAYIKQLPERVKEGQPSTNIIAWLEFTNSFDCSNGSTILAITDALESSTYITAKELTSGRKGLPEPDVSLKQCDLIFYGLGTGMEPAKVKNIRNAWRSYAEKAGANFTAIIP